LELVFFPFWKMWGCFWKARSLWTANSVAMVVVSKVGGSVGD
jgi:hypothetical protein